MCLAGLPRRYGTQLRPCACLFCCFPSLSSSLSFQLLRVPNGDRARFPSGLLTGGGTQTVPSYPRARGVPRDDTSEWEGISQVYLTMVYRVYSTGYLPCILDHSPPSCCLDPHLRRCATARHGVDSVLSHPRSQPRPQSIQFAPRPSQHKAADGVRPFPVLIRFPCRWIPLPLLLRWRICLTRDAQI